ncbi:MAG: GTP cyclohydrolase I [Veillonella sp.]|nr:GTP cyclohydrolase I [Veillonella sp.]
MNQRANDGIKQFLEALSVDTEAPELGLSKFQDVVNILSRRPQLQERLASELADAIMNDLSAHGVFVRITSTQLCMLIKGTMQQDSKVITLESRGVLAETGTVRDEALAMLGGGQVNV